MAAERVRRVARSVAAAGLAAAVGGVALSCGQAASPVPARSAPRPAAAPTAVWPSPRGPARWVIGAPTTPTFATGRGSERTEVVDLGRGRRGVVDLGERWAIEPGQPARAAPSLGAPALEARAIPEGLGGGYLFVLTDGVAFAATFDGAGKRFGSGRYVSLVGPRFVVLADGASDAFGLPDGAPIAGAPAIERGVAHPGGFAVVETPAGKTLYTRDGRTYLTLPFTRPRNLAVVPGGGVAVVGADGRVSRVASDGSVTLHDPALADLRIEPDERIATPSPRREPSAAPTPFDESRLVAEEGWVRAADDPTLFARTDGR